MSKIDTNSKGNLSSKVAITDSIKSGMNNLKNKLTSKTTEKSVPENSSVAFKESLKQMNASTPISSVESKTESAENETSIFNDEKEFDRLAAKSDVKAETAEKFKEIGSLLESDNPDAQEKCRDIINSLAQDYGINLNIDTSTNTTNQNDKYSDEPENGLKNAHLKAPENNENLFAKNEKKNDLRAVMSDISSDSELDLGNTGASGSGLDN